MATKKPKTISELTELTLTAKDNNQIKYEIGTIRKKLADNIKEQTGLSVEGYTHIIDNFAVKHTIAKHGNAKKEANRGQLAVTWKYSNIYRRNTDKTKRIGYANHVHKKSPLKNNRLMKQRADALAPLSTSETDFVSLTMIIKP